MLLTVSGVLRKLERYELQREQIPVILGKEHPVSNYSARNENKKVESPEKYSQFYDSRSKKFVLRNRETGKIEYTVEPQPKPFKDVVREIPGLPYPESIE